MRGSFDCFDNIPHMTGDVTYMHTNLTSYSLTSVQSYLYLYMDIFVRTQLF